MYVVTGGLLEIGKTYPDVHFLFMNYVTYNFHKYVMLNVGMLFVVPTEILQLFKSESFSFLIYIVETL